MTNSTIDIFRKNLKYYRTSLNLTQDKLSELSGISADYLSEIERRRKAPSFKRMDLIAKALNVEVYMLFKPLE